MRDRLPLVLSATALLVSVLGATPLGQAAYNAVVPRNSVGALQLRNGAVTNAKLRGDAVTSGKVRNHSLKAVDFRPGQLPAGTKGDKGDRGPKGDKGDKGDPALAGWEIVRASTVIPPNTSTTADAKCPEGKTVLGGAAGVQQIPGGLTIHTQAYGTFYRAYMWNTSTVNRQLNVDAICAVVAP